jgi:hypothetical protein
MLLVPQDVIVFDIGPGGAGIESDRLAMAAPGVKLTQGLPSFGNAISKLTHDKRPGLKFEQIATGSLKLYAYSIQRQHQ